MAFLEVKNLSKSFKGKMALDHFNVTLEKGKALTIIGDSGSGKTTFLRILNFLEKKDEGTIKLNGEILNGGEPLSSQEIAKRRRNLGFVFQNFNLFPQYTVWENAFLPLRLSLRREIYKGIDSHLFWSKKHQLCQKRYLNEIKMGETRLQDAFAKMGLGDKLKSYPCSLSGGEAQRAAIVRALALNPKILCFDEPTSALDPRLSKEVAQIIKELKKEGTTMIVVTHDMTFARRIADDVIFLEKGKEVESGSASILWKPKTAELASFLSAEKKNYENEEDKHIEAR